MGKKNLNTKIIYRFCWKKTIMHWRNPNWNWKSKEDSLTPFGDLQQFEASFVSTSSCKPQWVMFQNRRTPRCSLVAEEFFAGCRRNFFPLQLTTSADIGHRAFWFWLLNGFSANSAGSKDGCQFCQRYIMKSSQRWNAHWFEIKFFMPYWTH